MEFSASPVFEAQVILLREEAKRWALVSAEEKTKLALEEFRKESQAFFQKELG